MSGWGISKGSRKPKERKNITEVIELLSLTQPVVTLTLNVQFPSYKLIIPHSSTVMHFARNYDLQCFHTFTTWTMQIELWIVNVNVNISCGTLYHKTHQLWNKIIQWFYCKSLMNETAFRWNQVVEWMENRFSWFISTFYTAMGALYHTASEFVTYDLVTMDQDQGLFHVSL